MSLRTGAGCQGTILSLQCYHHDISLRPATAFSPGFHPLPLLHYREGNEKVTMPVTLHTMFTAQCTVYMLNYTLYIDSSLYTIVLGTMYLIFMLYTGTHSTVYGA